MYSELDEIWSFQFRINNVTLTLVIIGKCSECAPIKLCYYQSHSRKCVENYSFDFAAATSAAATSNTNTPAAAANATDTARVQLKCDGTRWGSEGETGEWIVYPVPFTLPRNMMYPALLPLMRTPRLPVVDWTDAPAHLNGLVCFAERRNMVSACVPSHFKCSLSTITATTSNNWN